MVINVNGRNYPISPQFIDDMMATALDGGIVYWCGKAEVPKEEGYKGEYASDQISRGGSLKLYDNESGECYTLDLEKFIGGLKLVIEQGYGTAEEIIEEEMYDAVTADNIIQLALFNDIVYG